VKDDSGGCGVGFILAAIVAIALIFGAALLVKNLADYNDAEASRLYARSELEASHARGEADIIRAQDQARTNQIMAEAQARAAIIAADSQARLDQAIAEAQMVLAQGQARLDSSQAFAVTAGASLPWLGIAGVVLLATILAMFGLALAALRGSQAPGGGPRVAILSPRRWSLPRPMEEPAALVVDESVFHQHWQ
jgi:ABC-type antimicrobial peptide transport system permease subunit